MTLLNGLSEQEWSKFALFILFMNDLMSSVKAEEINNTVTKLANSSNDDSKVQSTPKMMSDESVPDWVPAVKAFGVVTAAVIVIVILIMLVQKKANCKYCKDFPRGYVPGAYPLTHASQEVAPANNGGAADIPPNVSTESNDTENQRDRRRNQRNRMGNSQAVICRRDGFGFVRAMVCVADNRNMSPEDFAALPEAIAADPQQTPRVTP